MRTEVKSSQSAKYSNGATPKKAVEHTASIYKVSVHALGTWSDDYRGGVYITDIFEAKNREEAIGMACDNVKAHFPQHAIVAGKINVSLLNPFAL